MDGNTKKKFRAGLLIALLAGAIISVIAWRAPDFYGSFEAKTLDFRFQLRGPLPVRDDIVLLEIDEASLQELGRWPWPRDVLARAIETLKGLQAKAVLLDILFAEPSQLVVDKKNLQESLRFEENTKSLEDFIADAQRKTAQANAYDANAALAQLKTDAVSWENNMRQALAATLQDNDLVFADAIEKAGNVYLSSHFEILQSDRDILRYRKDQELKNSYLDWIKNNPTFSFSQLPNNLRRQPEFTIDQLRALFIKTKLQYLFRRNLELSVEDALPFMQEEAPATVRRLYRESKAGVFREEVERVFTQSGKIFLEDIVASLGLFNAPDIQLLTQEYQAFLAQEMFAQKSGIAYSGTKGLYQAISFIPPIAPLTQAMKSAGHFNAPPDKDGVLRRVPLVVRYKDRVYPHSALRVASDIWGVDLAKGMCIQPGKSITIGPREIPVDGNGCILLNWAGKWHSSFARLSIAEVCRLGDLGRAVASGKQLSAQAPQDQSIAAIVAQGSQKQEELKSRLAPRIKGKICIIGLSAAGTHDHFPTPLESYYPAMGTHATIMNSLLEGTFLSRVDARINYALIFFVALSCVCIASALAPTAGLVCIALAACAYCAFSFLLFTRAGMWVDITGPLASGLLSYVGATSYNYATVEKEKRWIRKAFSHYLSKSVMDEILKDPAKLKLGGESKELTILFVDVRNFTGYTEKHHPEEVIAILNEFLNEMSKIIFKYDGTLDKYVGDEIMAIFGAPANQKDHAYRAVAVALEMIEQTHSLQERWRREGRDPLDIGIGINTGSMIIGNVGSLDRMNYTVIGDAVNLAARIQALTRHYDNHVMISEFTHAHIKDAFLFKPLDAIQVKGKQEMVTMYEVLGFVDKDAPKKK